MKQKMITFGVAMLLMTALHAQQTVTVEIDFGGEKPAETHQVEWFDGITAMSALQSCATIESYPIKSYIFVGTINGVKTERTHRAWYYEVNGQSTGRIAFRYVVQPGDVVRWIYKADVCSPKNEKKECEK